MFTGIIEEIGKVSDIYKSDNNYKIKIKANKVLKNTSTGDSICTNGVCLTVSYLDNNFFVADVMEETLNVSNLKDLKTNSKVNLERALTLNKPLGGHIVTGHIDGVGTITNISENKNACIYTISTNSDVLKYIVYKGSITIDGISLTVADVKDTYFKVSIIPHTLKETILNFKSIGDTVNLETDIIGKYVEKLLTKKENKKENLSLSKLEQYGFL